MKSNNLLPCILLLWCSCKSPSKSDSIVKQNQRSNIDSNILDTVVLKSTLELKKLDSLYQLVYSKDDTNAYRKLDLYYEWAKTSDEFLACSMYMANKTQFPPAFFRIYVILSKGDYRAFHHLDDKSKNLCMYYLVKSYELGFSRAKLELSTIYPQMDFKPSKEYLTEYGN